MAKLANLEIVTKCMECGTPTYWETGLGDKPLCPNCWGAKADMGNKLAAYKREYYQKNRDKLAASKREYYQKNRDKLAAYQREYYQMALAIK